MSDYDIRLKLKVWARLTEQVPNLRANVVR